MLSPIYEVFATQNFAAARFRTLAFRLPSSTFCRDNFASSCKDLY